MDTNNRGKNFSKKNKSSRGMLSNSRQLRKEEKTGRNWKCPCGSGKKYKYCCLEKE